MCLYGRYYALAHLAAHEQDQEPESTSREVADPDQVPQPDGDLAGAAAG